MSTPMTLETREPVAAAASEDSDGDQIPNARDQCPGIPEDFDRFQDEDGCPDRDNDGDGVLDAAVYEHGAWLNCDRALHESGEHTVSQDCRDEPENYNGLRDEDGCPEIHMFHEQRETLARVPVLRRGRRLALPRGARARLRDAARIVRELPSCTCRVNGYLAREVVDHLVALGAPRERLLVRDFGRRAPASRQADPPEDLRVELLVTGFINTRTLCETGAPREREVCGCPQDPAPVCSYRRFTQLLESEP